MSIRLSEPDLWTDKVPSCAEQNKVIETATIAMRLYIVHDGTSSCITNPPLSTMKNMWIVSET